MRILNPSGRDSQQMWNTADALPSLSIRRVESGTYNVAANVATMACRTMRGPTTVVLPRAALHSGRSIMVKKVDAGSYPVTVKSANGESIDGNASVQLATKDEYAQFLSNGREWTMPVHF